MCDRRWVLALCVFLGLACGDGGSDPVGPPPVGTELPEEALTVLQQGTAAPPLAQHEITFVAVRGEQQDVRLRYAPRAGEIEGEEFLRFRLDDESLLLRPDGAPFADGESIAITIRVPDPTRFLVELEPSGLRFSEDEPARLEVKFAEAEGADDDRVVERLSLWRQEASGQPWERLASVLVKDLREMRAELTGFSNYAIAY